MHRDFCSSFLWLERTPQVEKDKMANRRQRRSERQSAVTPATAEQWFLQLPDGPCRTAVVHCLDEARRGGASVEGAMAQGLAYATRLFPEEIVLWGLDGALGPIPWQNESFQRGIRASTLALRELRSQYIDLAGQRDALLAEVRALGVSQPFQPPAAFVPFVGTGRRLDEDLSSLD